MIDEDEIRRRVHRRLRMDEHAALLDARQEAEQRSARRPRAAGQADAGRGTAAEAPGPGTPLISLAFEARLEHTVNSFLEDS